MSEIEEQDMQDLWQQLYDRDRLILAMADRIAAQSELLSRRAERPATQITEADQCPL